MVYVKLMVLISPGSYRVLLSDVVHPASIGTIAGIGFSSGIGSSD